MKLDSKQLSGLIDRVARAAIRETLSPILKDEREKQKELAQDLKDLRSSKKKQPKKSDKDLEEAEEDSEGNEVEKGGSTEEPTSEKPKVVSRKLATGKSEPEAPKAVIPNPSDIKDVTFDQVITLMNMMRSGKSTKDPRTAWVTILRVSTQARGRPSSYSSAALPRSWPVVWMATLPLTLPRSVFVSRPRPPSVTRQPRALICL